MMEKGCDPAAKQPTHPYSIVGLLCDEDGRRVREVIQSDLIRSMEMLGASTLLEPDCRCKPYNRTTVADDDSPRIDSGP